MNKIKFSHIYNKMKNIDLEKSVMLLEVFKVDSANLFPLFVDYDTAYFNKNYKLPKGKVLILLFKQDNNLFTTVRSAWRKSKYDYYLDQKGKEFKIILETKN